MKWLYNLDNNIPRRPAVSLDEIFEVLLCVVLYIALVVIKNVEESAPVQSDITYMHITFPFKCHICMVLQI